jgi:exo-beta-1,3-glucanase (GH17 family)
MFCIGTELTRLSLEKTEYWRSLIQEVRAIFSGKITYAANWYQEYENITFWDKLDYIGIQAYFPLTNNESPSLAQISKGWSKHISAIEKVSKRYGRKVLFTEMGYKSTVDSAIRPWEWIDYENFQEEQESQETQGRCYQAFFETVWPQDWMAGVHLWQMRSDHIEHEGRSHLDFTPQGKTAATIITAGYL